VFSEAAQPPVAAPWPARAVVGSANSLADLANNYQRDLLSALASWRSGLLSSEEFGLLDWALRSGVLHSEPTAEIDRVLKQIHEQEDRIPEPIYVASMTEGTPLDEPVFIRGSHRRPGALEPRHFLEAIDGPQPRPFSRGSGRLELAQRIADSSNPLTARVMVNNVWHHLFGRGIIPSVDNFGVLGEKPTHPELLDFLAAAFSSSPPGHRDFPEHPAFGWSIKKLIRFIMLSRSYQMASEAGDGVAEERDPNNLLWHRTNLRRLEGEAIRDSMLAISGRLDESMFGPSVPIHLTPFMDGRGRPSQSGPLDGNGRRSIYVEVRRNFLSPMMLAFDTPIPATTVGKRAVSNVPAQALILMNDPFVIEQARIWARNTQHGAPGMPSDQITRLYLAAYGRPPTAQELAAALGFLDEQSRSFQTGADQTERAWADLCHVIFNTKEFIFLN
jgi:hypothetical protein